MGKALFALIKLAYSSILRPLVAEKVEDTASQIDDIILGVLDKLFDYSEPSK